MSSNFVAQGVKQKTIVPDEYMDMAIKNVLTFNAKIVEKEVIDLEKFEDMQIHLINLCENVGIGTGYINKKKTKIDPENLTDEEKKVFEALKDYYNSKENIFGVNVERLASSLLQQVVEGEYDSKINFMKEKLNERIKEGTLNPKAFDIQLANFKFQLILDAVSVGKAKGVEFNV